MEKSKMNPAVVKVIIWSTVVVLLFIFALIGPNFAPHDPYEVNTLNVKAPPSAEFPFGTDYIGRCILSRLLHGAARSIFAAIPVVIYNSSGFYAGSGACKLYHRPFRHWLDDLRKTGQKPGA